MGGTRLKEDNVLTLGQINISTLTREDEYDVKNVGVNILDLAKLRVTLCYHFYIL